MQEASISNFYAQLLRKSNHRPISGEVELTYRCNFNCIYCFCKGSEDKNRELTTREWKKIFAEIKAEGCVYLAFSGGEPLIREDFLALYSYAKKLGFIVTIFTNAFALKGQILDYLAKAPPYFIEVTFNGITPKTYETITQKKGSFLIVLQNLRKAKEKKLPLIIKSNCLQANKNEIAKIKKFAETLLGKVAGRYRFKYDPMLFPRLDGNKNPLQYRLSFAELLALRRQDKDIWQEYERNLHRKPHLPPREKEFLYWCSAWKEHFFISPNGRLKFCLLSQKFSTDLTKESFKVGFYHKIPQLLKERFKTDSVCSKCLLRKVCYYCPARAYLETGHQESKVAYYCQLANSFIEALENTRWKNRP